MAHVNAAQVPAEQTLEKQVTLHHIFTLFYIRSKRVFIFA